MQSSALLVGEVVTLVIRNEERPCLLFDEAFFEDFFVAEPEVGDVGGAEAEDVFECAADFAEMKIHADALEQFDERVRANRLDGLWPDAVAVHAVIGDDVNGLGAGAVPVDVKEAAGSGLRRGEPRCYT